MKYILVFIICLVFNHCYSTQNSEKDSLTKEFKFLSVCFPENIQTISYNELHLNLITKGAIKEKELPYATLRNYSTKNYIKELRNGVEIKLEYLVANDTILGFTIEGHYSLTSRLINKHYQNQDTLSKPQLTKLLSIIYQADSVLLSRKKYISDFMITRLTNIYPIVNQEPHISSIDKSGGINERMLQWLITNKKGPIRIIDFITGSPSVTVNESTYEGELELYIKDLNTIKTQTIYYKRFSFVYGAIINDYFTK